MREEEARFAETITVGGVRITPLVLVEQTLEKHRGGKLSGSGKLTPLGVLIEAPDETKALDLDGNPLPFKEG